MVTLCACCRYDEDGSGGIDADELYTALDELGLPVEIEEAARLVTKYDSNNSGTLEISEFLELVSEMASGPRGVHTASPTVSPGRNGEPEKDRLALISEAGGINPLVLMLSSANSQARENAAGALMHLALDPENQVAIAKADGIKPLVAILEDGTPKVCDTPTP